MKRKKVGLFGGSFDPIHLGHVQFALELKEKLFLDEVWFIPNWKSPFKKNDEVLPVSHRVAMIRLAIEKYPYFKLQLIECEKRQVAYTVDTIKELKVKYPEIDFYLLLGSDLASSFHLWKEPEVIKKLVPVIVGKRAGSVWQESEKFFEVEALNISSTEIRSLIKMGGECKASLPEGVWDYIQSHHLYTD